MSAYPLTEARLNDRLHDLKKLLDEITHKRFQALQNIGALDAQLCLISDEIKEITYMIPRLNAWDRADEIPA